jgi:dephospho-CoA kinase
VLVIGLTGGIACGKSEVARMLADKGIDIIDADKIAHDFLKPGMPSARKIIKIFGKQILLGKDIDRRKLAKIVFSNTSVSRERRKTLNSILHPLIINYIKKDLNKYRKSKKKAVILNAPLLLETGLEKEVDIIVVVSASRQKQIERLVIERKMSETEAVNRIKAQMPLKDKVKIADYVIDTNEPLKHTQKQVEELWQKLMS